MALEFDETENDDLLLGYTVEIVVAHVGHNSMAVADVPNFIQQVHGALSSLSAPAEPEETAAVPIIDPRKSVKPDYIICLECGKKTQIMKAHLRAQHGLTPEEYREKYSLPKSYPMTAPNTTKAYRERALKMGLHERMKAGRNKTRKTVGKPPLKTANQNQGR